MRNNKGFTLIELLVTILLLSVITVISYVSVIKVIEKSGEKDCENLRNSIKSAVSNYVSDNRYKNKSVISAGTMDASVLVNGNYLSSPIYNPFKKEEISPSEINISFELNNNYTVNKVTITSSKVDFVNCKK